MTKATAGFMVNNASGPQEGLMAMSEVLSGEGLTYRLTKTFRTSTGVPGYAFDVSEGAAHIGNATLLISADHSAVERTGHMGCELVPEFRKRGYVPRLARGLVPFVREHGLTTLTITCDVGHDSLRQSILELGAMPLDQLPATAEDTSKERFLWSI